MDRTSIIILVLCVVVMLCWTTLVNKIFPPKPLPAGATNAIATASVTNRPVMSAAPAQGLTPEIPSTAAMIADTNTPEEVMMVTNAEARYTFSSRGGGIKLVELLKYPESVAKDREKMGQTNVASLNDYSRAPTLAVLDSSGQVQGDGIFKLERTLNGMRASKVLTNGLTVTKDFQITNDYLINTTVRFENHSGQTLQLPSQEWAIGTAAPMGPEDNGQAVGVIWYNGSKAVDLGAATYFSSRGFACTPRTPPSEFRGGESNVVWAAAHNQFFALALMPRQPAQALMVSRRDLPRPTGEAAKLVAANAPAPQGYEASLVFPSVTLTTNQSFERQVMVYAGPKEYQTLARVTDTTTNNFDQIMGLGFFGFVSKALLLSMNWMNHSLNLSYGWAIVVITFVIKMVFWPLTASSTRSMKRMQTLQPQIKALQEKYKDEPQKLSQKQWEFWRKNKVNPMGSCLPMLLQIPVFFGFLTMIRSAIELRGASWLWVKDLSKPDTLYMIPGLGFIPFIGVAGVGLPLNLLPLIMGATMLWQARLTPPSPGVDPAQQAIMKYLPLIFLVGLYNFSAGMTLYWTVNNLLTITQTKLTRTATEPPAGQAPAGPVLTGPPKKRK